MPRWKATTQILDPSKDGEYFDENWMNYDRISQYAPPIIEWTGDRPMQVEDVDLWEVITEQSGPVGVYAAYMPFGELYVVTSDWRVVAEFTGWNANGRLEEYLIANSIPYPKDNDVPVADFVSKKLLIA